jgi:hypothetical protein
MQVLNMLKESKGLGLLKEPPKDMVLGKYAVGLRIAAKFDTGWFRGVVTFCRGSTTFPFDVEYQDGIWKHELTFDRCDANRNARAGSWALVMEQADHGGATRAKEGNSAIEIALRAVGQ